MLTQQKSRISFLAALAGFAMAALCGSAFAQSPSAARPITLIVPSTPGGSVDAQARVLGEFIARDLGQPVVIENKPGASGLLAFSALAKAPADGHTLGYGWMGLAINPAMIKALPFDIASDFTPVSLTGTSPTVMLASSATGVRNVRELLALAKSDPKKVSFAASEATARLGFELFRQKAALTHDYTVASYKGGAPMITDLLGGHVGFGIVSMNAAMGVRQDPRVHVLGVIAAERSPFMPELPTFAEQGVPDFQIDAWFGVFGPRGMPDAVTARIHAAVARALASEQVQAAFQKLLVQPQGSSAADFARLVRTQVDAWKVLAQRAGIEPQ